MFVCVCVCVCVQDYPNALRVTVKGAATLMLITDNTGIKMDNQTSLVSDDDGDEEAEDEDDDICIFYQCFVVCQRGVSVKIQCSGGSASCSRLKTENKLS